MVGSNAGVDPSDRREIEELINLYTHAADDPSADGVRRIFSEDGVFDATHMDAGRYEGAQAIIDFFDLGKPPHPPSHQTTNIYVYEESGTVKAISKYISPDITSDGVMTGDYRDTLVRQDDGWRIKERYLVGRNPVGHDVSAAFE